jgi:xylulokinase
MGALIAGIDCSTQATKVLVIDPDTGRTVGSGRADHVVDTGGGRSETDPDVWWSALRSALAQTGLAHEIGALAVGGQQHGLVLQDAAGRALRPAVLWNDVRSAGVVDDLVTALGGADEWARRTGSVPVPSFTVTSLAWLRRVEPEVFDRVAGVRLPHDHLTERLTGRAVTDRGDASGTGWWSPRDGHYVTEILELPQVGLDPAWLPTVLGPREAAGTVTRAAADELGLGEGVVVGPGTGDNMAASLGLGLAPGTPVVSLGTSGTAYVASSAPTHDPSGVVAGFAGADGDFLPLVCTLNCTLAIDRFAGWLQLERDAIADRTDCVVLPYLDGERTPNLPHAAGSVIGLRHDTSPGEILLAAYEGAVASLLGGFEVMAATGATIDADQPIVLLGGGSRGAAWQRTVGRASGRELLLPDAPELVALGAAVQAASVLGDRPARDVATDWDTAAGRRIEPVEHDPTVITRVHATVDALSEVLAQR